MQEIECLYDELWSPEKLTQEAVTACITPASLPAPVQPRGSCEEVVSKELGVLKVERTNPETEECVAGLVFRQLGVEYCVLRGEHYHKYNRSKLNSKIFSSVQFICCEAQAMHCGRGGSSSRYQLYEHLFCMFLASNYRPTTDHTLVRFGFLVEFYPILM